MDIYYREGFKKLLNIKNISFIIGFKKILSMVVCLKEHLRR